MMKGKISVVHLIAEIVGVIIAVLIIYYLNVGIFIKNTSYDTEDKGDRDRYGREMK